MFKQGDLSIKQKHNGCFSSQVWLFYGFKTLTRRGFCFKTNRGQYVPLKIVLGTFNIDPRLRDWHVFM